MSKKLVYTCICPDQSQSVRVFSFAATVEDIQKFAKIDRITRSNNGELIGFQRPQIAKHIMEIKEYLNTPGSILPNPIVVAFISGVEMRELDSGLAQITIDIGKEPGGFIVDGQQRFLALLNLSTNRKFEVFVSRYKNLQQEV